MYRYSIIVTAIAARSHNGMEVCLPQLMYMGLGTRINSSVDLTGLYAKACFGSYTTEGALNSEACEWNGTPSLASNQCEKCDFVVHLERKWKHRKSTTVSRIL